MPKDTIPAIPPVPRQVDGETRAFMQAMKDNLQTRAGQTKNRLDYSPTIRELEAAGVIQLVSKGLGAGGPPIIIGGPAPGTPFDDITIPLAPTNVVVRATPWYHHVTWDLTTEQNNWIVSHGEVWYSDVNDRTTALLAGVGTIAFSMPVEPLAEYYYWVRYISYANVSGIWSNDIFDGVFGQSPPDPQALLDTLAGQITEGELYQTLNARIDGIEVNAGDISGIGAKYTVKIGVDGHVAGFGLINTGNAFDELGGHSQFGVSADTFWVGAPGKSSFNFIVDNVNNRVVMDGAFIVDATITGAAIGNAAIDTAHIGDGTITTLKVEDGAIQNAKIGDLLRSYTLDLSSGRGWQIQKSGRIDAAEINIYDQSGQVILSSGPSGAAYHSDIDNKAQMWAQISNLPDSFETLAFMHCDVGGYGDITVTPNVPSNGRVSISGRTFYSPAGVRFDHTGWEQTTIDTGMSTGYHNAIFIMWNQYRIDAIFPGWNYGGNTSRYFFPAIFDYELKEFTALDAGGSQYKFDAGSGNFCIVATCARYPGEPAGIQHFTNMVGANLFLPEDGATRTGVDNIVPDGQFEGLRLDGGSIPNNNWWGVTGHIEYRIDNWSGPMLRFFENGAFAWPKDPITKTQTYYRCKAGELLYCMQSTSSNNPGSGDGISLVIVFWDENKANASVQYPVHRDTFSAGTWYEDSGVAQVPNSKHYFTINPYCWGVHDAHVRSVIVTRSPSELTVGTAATYIKDAAIDTLMLAGQAVTFPRYYTFANLPVTWELWLKVATCATFTPSSAAVPLCIHWSLEQRNSNVNAQSSGRFALERNSTTVHSQTMYYLSAAFSYPGTRHGIYIDTGHGGGSCTYNLWLHGEAGDPNDVEYATVVIYELKR